MRSPLGEFVVLLECRIRILLQLSEGIKRCCCWISGLAAELRGEATTERAARSCTTTDVWKRRIAPEGPQCEMIEQGEVVAW
jgi:hypothetical protein